MENDFKNAKKETISNKIQFRYKVLKCSNTIQRTAIKQKELKVITFLITLRYNVLQENTVPIVPVIFALIDGENIDYTVYFLKVNNGNSRKCIDFAQR